MASDAEQIATIKSQTLARIVEITAKPKPSYNIDGQEVLWGDYLKKLQASVSWCDKELARETPLEQHTVGFTS